MQLSFETISIDPDDNTLQIWLTAEVPTHKTGLEFYNNADFLVEFGRQLLKFPFEDNKSLIYEYGNWANTVSHIKITIALEDALGRCSVTVLTEEFDSGAKAEFSGEAEVSDLQELGHLMIAHDFTVINNPLKWATKS